MSFILFYLLSLLLFILFYFFFVFLLNFFFFLWLKQQQLLSSISIFSGIQENESKSIDISKLGYDERRKIRETFVRSGFADDSVGYFSFSRVL